MATTIQYRGTRADLRRLIGDVVSILSGDTPDRLNIRRGFSLAIGFAALSDIKDAFITKSRGGTDEAGITWPKLSKKYLAYGRRFGPGEQSRLKRGAGLGRGHSRAPGGKKGLLSGGQLKQWRFLFATHLARYRLSEDEQSAKRHAAAVAWSVMKRRGAKTKLDVFGSRDVDILRDVGILLNSLSPGILSGEADSAHYAPPGGPGGSEQIFHTPPGEVIVGTNVVYASSHQKGKGTKQRKILPDEENPVPAVWWSRWLRVGAQGLSAAIAAASRRAA